jgi:cadmium resistance protein CadD (predicted permease)
VTVGVGTKWSAITRRAASSCSDVGGETWRIIEGILLGLFLAIFVPPSKVGLVQSLYGVIVVATFAFIGTMFDNFFAFAAQLALTERVRFKRVSIAQALGVATLVALAAGVGTLLEAIPTRWIGLLCIAPWALALHGWRHRTLPAHEQYRRGALTTFTLCLALGGDNLAVWIPLLRANETLHELLTIGVFALWEVGFLLCARAIASHPRVISWGTRYGRSIIPWVYLGLGVLILIECKTFT